MSSEIGDFYKAQKRERKVQGAHNRDAAESTYDEARSLADRSGMDLVRKDSSLYRLRHRAAGWLINVYPGNQRLYSDKNKPKAPWLSEHLPEDGPWSLLDVVEAAIAAERKFQC